MSFVSSFIKVPHFFYLPYAIGYSWAYINSSSRDFHICGDYKFLHTLYNAGLGFRFLTEYLFFLTPNHSWDRWLLSYIYW